jgi:hypothetical protein
MNAQTVQDGKGERRKKEETRVRVYGSGGGDGGGDGIFELLPLGVGHKVDGLFDYLERQIVDLGGLRHTHIFGAEQFHRRARL